MNGDVTRQGNVAPDGEPRGKTWMEACTIPCGRIAGIPVRYHLLCLAAVALAMIAQIGRPWKFWVWAALAFGLILPVTVLIHELGHAAAARCAGTPAHSILLWPLGGLAFIGRTASPGRDLGVALAGPATHMPQACAWLLIQLFSFKAIKKVWVVWPLGAVVSPADSMWLALATFGVAVNVWLLVFNLLPAYPLDGGRVLADVLLLLRVPVRVAASIVVALGLAAGAGVIAYGMLRMKNDAFILAIGVFVILSIFELLAALVAGKVASHPLFDYPGTSSGGAGFSSGYGNGGGSFGPAPGWTHWGSGRVGGGESAPGVSMVTQPPPPPPPAWNGLGGGGGGPAPTRPAAGAPPPPVPPPPVPPPAAQQPRPQQQSHQPNSAMLGSGYEPSAPV